MTSFPIRRYPSRVFLWALGLLLACHVAEASVLVPSGHHRFYRNGDKTVLIWQGAGSVTVTKPCMVELLMVGGGGGGGPFVNSGLNSAGGGGAGGFVHQQSFSLSAGTYEIAVGAGGAPGQNGGDTMAFGLTAYGGGAGAGALNSPVAQDGASGGGASHFFDGSALVPGGKAIHGDQGHDGESSTHVYGAGGGGGAGAAAPSDHSTPSQPSSGGEGLPCSITGTEVWYAGGGAGSRMQFPANGGDKKLGGKGGGGDSGQPGVDGLGGGGSGGFKGGGGVFILSFVDDDEVAFSDDFDVQGGTTLGVYGKDAQVHTFLADGTLTVTGTGVVDVLLVGGGGGGGVNSETYGGAGGGAGGLIYYTNVAVSAGTYAIHIGAGGAIGENGGDTTALAMIAHGGGAGVGASSAMDGNVGGSGGGGRTVNATWFNGGAAIGIDGNIGHAGGGTDNIWGPGGGGGAGACGADLDDTHALAIVMMPGRGGDGLVCDITGKPVYYAGGGAGLRLTFDKLVPGGAGGGGRGLVAGTDGLGGGGGGGAAGGSGVVIVRVNKALQAERELPDATGGVVTRDRGYNVHTFTTDGTFTIPTNGVIEVLAVGGGGGGGNWDSTYGGAGGGAGGFVHRAEMVVGAGEYAITIGAGGAIGQNGGDTKVFDIVAYGGGHGADYQNRTAAGDGASGGGSTTTMAETQAAERVWRAGGRAIYGDEENQGHDGGTTCHIYGPSGGGAGAPGGDSVSGKESTPTVGGDGLPCFITGAEVWYAGGGAGFRNTYNVSGGKGGGGSSSTDASMRNGTNGLGGGGAGAGTGGSGVVIIRYKRQPRGTVVIVR